VVRNAYKFRSENLKWRDQYEDLGLDGRIILEWILGKWGGRLEAGCVWLGMGTGGGLLWMWW